MYEDNFSKKIVIVISIICIIVITLSGVLMLSLENRNNSIIMKADTFSEENEEIIISVNINTAPKEELMLLNNIGKSKAEAIIEYRKTKPFENIEDIMNVKGIGLKMFERIKDNICVE